MCAKGEDPQTLTLEQALKLIDEKAAKTGKGRKKATKKKAASKKTTKKKSSKKKSTKKKKAADE